MKVIIKKIYIYIYIYIYISKLLYEFFKYLYLFLEKISEAYISAGTNERFKFEIWKYSLEYYCRSHNNTEESLVFIRTQFENCFTEINNFTNNEELLLKIHLMKAEFESYRIGDKTKMIEAMEAAVRLGRGSHLYWILYINYEKFFGDVLGVRKIYKRAVEYTKDKEDKKTISQLWISWEKL